MQLVRETAIQCLVAMSEMPHTRIYPMKAQVCLVCEFCEVVLCDYFLPSLWSTVHKDYPCLHFALINSNDYIRYLKQYQRLLMTKREPFVMRLSNADKHGWYSSDTLKLFNTENILN